MSATDWAEGVSSH